MELKKTKSLKKVNGEVEVVGTEYNDGLFNENTGVFYFTNATNEDFSTQWNKIEYTFPKQKTVPMYIQGESPENVQNIRKMFAHRLAQREFFKSSEFKKLNGIKANGYATTYDEKLLQPWIDSCLKPLPQAKLGVKDKKEVTDGMFHATKPVTKAMSLNEQFKDQDIVELGAM